MLDRMSCQHCGAEVPADARFCGSCGHPVAAHLEERRVVTVLFADLVGFTSLSETLDPEQVKRIVDSAFERLVRDVTAFGGRVDKIIGDAIVALFGAPTAHEDDAERAVRAGLRMLDTLAEYAREARIDIRMRIGVNTGEVLVGALRAGGDYTAMGDVVNTASRVQTSADPGTVVVGDSTYGATRDVFVYESRGQLFARGREQPIDVWQPIEALLPPGYRPRRPLTPLVGRDAEIAVIDNTIEVSIRNGRGQQILLLGEAGVGKTRIANEIAPLVRSHHPDVVVLNGRCVPYGEANPWWPIADAIRDGCGIDLDEPLDEARSKTSRSVELAMGATPANAAANTAVINGLLHLLGYEGPLRGLDPTRARGEATQALLTFMEASVRERPLVVRIADLHWADELVLEMIDTLSGQLARLPFVLVATARRSLLKRWTPTAGRYNSLVLNIDPLDRNSASELLDFLAAGTIDPRLREVLLDRSGGNPFYLEELVTLTEASGAGHDAIVATGSELPDTLRGLMSARIDGLSTTEQLTLEDAAVWGSSGPIEALRRLSEGTRGVSDIDPTVASLESKEILTFDGENWAFRSDLVREVAYSRLTKSDRLQRHLGIGSYLEMAFGGRFIDDGFVETVARHFYEAARLAMEPGANTVAVDLPERALRWVLEAARRAEQTAAWPLAERLYTQGLELAVDVDHDSLRLSCLLGRSHVRSEQWRFDAARVDARRARELADAAGDIAGQAHALVKLGEVDAREGEPGAAEVPLSRAIDLFNQIDDVHGRAQAQRWLGMAALLRNDNAAAKAPVEASLVDFRAVGDRRGEAWALQNLAWIAFATGHVKDAQRWLDESSAAFTEIGDSGGLAWTIGLQAFVRFFEGRFGEARELAQQILTETERRGDRWGQGMMLIILGAITLWEGQTVDAIAAGQTALDHFDSLGDAVGLEQALALVGRGKVMVGEVSEGLSLLSRALDAAPRTGGPSNIQLGIVADAVARVQLGQLELMEHLAWVTAPIGDFEDDSFGHVELVVAAGLAMAMRGQFDDATTLLTRLTAEDPRSGFAASVAAVVAATHGESARASELRDLVVQEERSTYLDRMLAYTAVGLGGDPRGFASASAEVDATDDQLARAIICLATATTLEAARAPSDAERLAAETARAEADHRWGALGVDPNGWQRIFDQAATHLR